MALSRRPATSPKLRAAVLALIACCYVGIGMWLAQNRSSALLMPIPIINVDLSPGPGVGLVRANPSSTKTPDTVEDSTSVLQEADKSAEPTAATPALDPEVAPTSDPVDPSAPEAVSDSNAPYPPVELELDILQQVEALIGTTSTELAVDVQQVDTETSQGWTASQSGGGGPCGLTDLIAANLLADQMALAELTAYPPALRSVSNAIQLWNGEWLRTTAGSEPAMPALRRVISETISEGPGECLQASLQGPRFVFVTPVGKEPIILVIGSGDWRWTDLTVPDRPFFARWFGATP